MKFYLAAIMALGLTSGVNLDRSPHTLMVTDKITKTLTGAAEIQPAIDGATQHRPAFFIIAPQSYMTTWKDSFDEFDSILANSYKKLDIYYVDPELAANHYVDTPTNFLQGFRKLRHSPEFRLYFAPKSFTEFEKDPTSNNLVEFINDNCRWG